MDGLIIPPNGRGCGDPQEGGFYAWIPSSENGVPPEKYLLDYPHPVPGGLKIKPRGLTMFEKDGIWYVVDWIGEKYYPNFPDWWEELCRFGFHQRVETNLDLSKLDREKSRYLVAHKRGMLRTTKDIEYLLHGAGYDDRTRYVNCPILVCDHESNEYYLHENEWGLNIPPKGMCTGLLWQALIKGEDPELEDAEGDMVVRKMPSFEYYGFEVEKKLKWQPAFLASFPISMMHWLIYKGKGGEEKDTVKKLKNAPAYVMERTYLVDAKKIKEGKK